MPYDNSELIELVPLASYLNKRLKRLKSNADLIDNFQRAVSRALQTGKSQWVRNAKDIVYSQAIRSRMRFCHLSH